MSFLTFLMYFIISKIIYDALNVGLYFLYKKYVNYKFQKALKEGTIKIVKLNDLVEDNSDKTWN